MAAERELEKYHRRLPHWRFEGSVYYVTFRISRGELSAPEIKAVLDHVVSGNDRFYTLFAATIMPDHGHLLLRPDRGYDLSRIMKGTKGVSAHLVNKLRGTTGRIWQDESWDRIVRDQAELEEKLKYMLDNAVKRGLVEDPWEWIGWWMNHGVM